MAWTLDMGRLAVLALAWLTLHLPGHLVLCHGLDGRISVEPALYGHCDTRPLVPETANDLPDASAVSASTGCQDTPLLTAPPDYDGVRVLRKNKSGQALNGVRAFPTPTRAAPGKTLFVATGRRLHPPHLLHLRTTVLLT